MQLDLTNRTALVTGANRNLGRVIAQQLGAAGACVLVHGRDESAVAAACREMADGLGDDRFVPIVANLADPASIDAMYARIDRQGHSLDILVHNAAHLGVGPDFLDTTDAFFADVIAVNVTAAFKVLQHAARRMALRRRGTILNVSSVASERALYARAAYNASKAAQDALIRSMAIELAPLGISVNTIAPGYIWTPRWNSLTDNHRQRRHANTPAGAPTQAREIAALVTFLACGFTPSMVGARLAIDGGVDVQQLPRDVCV